MIWNLHEFTWAILSLTYSSRFQNTILRDQLTCFRTSFGHFAWSAGRRRRSARTTFGKKRVTLPPSILLVCRFDLKLSHLSSFNPHVFALSLGQNELMANFVPALFSAILYIDIDFACCSLKDLCAFGHLGSCHSNKVRIRISEMKFTRGIAFGH